MSLGVALIMALGGIFLFANRAWGAGVALFVIAGIDLLVGEAFERRRRRQRA
jgi:hypothetical protein